MTPQAPVLLALLGATCLAIGLYLLIFASRVQAYALHYQPPPWEEPLWAYFRDHYLPSLGYLVTVRAVGLGLAVIGVVVLIAVAKGGRL